MATPAAAAATPKGPVTDAYHRILESIAPNAAVLKQNYNGYLGRGLAAAAAIHIAALGAYWSYIKATEVEVVAASEEPIQVAYADIEPPSIEDAPPPPAGPLEFSEVQPVLIGGIERLQSGIEYPDFERRAGTEGRVIVRFVVSPSGVPSDIEVVRRVSPGLDQAAVQAVQRARFEPGQQNGQAVAVRFTLPVTFRIR